MAKVYAFLYMFNPYNKRLMIFKDYYATLGVLQLSDSRTIQEAYDKQVELLGLDACLKQSPNYNQRIELEEAYRILKLAFIKKEYDEEYGRYQLSDDKDNYVICDEWLERQIKYERNKAIDIVSKNVVPNHSTKKSKMRTCLGCTIKIIGVCISILLFLYVMTAVKNCSRSQIRDTKLTQLVEDINHSYPKKIDNNITCKGLAVEDDALVYEYVIDDTFFQTRKHEVLSKHAQLEYLKQYFSKMKPMIDLLMEKPRGITYRYICRDSKKIYECKLSFIDLAELYKKDNTN